MKVGDLIKMKGPKAEYSWRRGISAGVGIVIAPPHRTERTMRGCTVLWPDKDPVDVPEDWLEVINESR